MKQLFQLKALEEWGAVRALSYTAVAQQYSSSTEDQDDQGDQGDQEEGHKTSVGRIGRGCFVAAAKVGYATPSLPHFHRLHTKWQEHNRTKGPPAYTDGQMSINAMMHDNRDWGYGLYCCC